MFGHRSGSRLSELESERWLTYAEVGDLLGVSAAAARMLAKRRGWSRCTPNAYGDRARVLVPDDIAVRPRSVSYAEHTAYAISSDREGANERDQANVRVFEQAITALQEQLAIANARADRAEQQVDKLQAALTEERQRLIALLVDKRPFWRRWFR